MAILNPILSFGDDRMVMMTQYAKSVSKKTPGLVVGSMVAHECEIARALDLLMAGI